MKSEQLSFLDHLSASATVNEDFTLPFPSSGVTGDTWITTVDGPRKAEQLSKRGSKTVAEGIVSINGFATVAVGDGVYYEITTKEGLRICGAPGQLVRTMPYRSQKIQHEGWMTFASLKPGDRLVFSPVRGMTWGHQDPKARMLGWVIGSLYGDGNIQKDGIANLDFWGETREAMHGLALLSLKEVMHTSPLIGKLKKLKKVLRVSSRELGRAATRVGFSNQGKHIGDKIERKGSEFHRGFLSGWFDADGGVQGDQRKGISVRLTSSELSNLKAAQRMLARLGIQSCVYENRIPAGPRLMYDSTRVSKKLYDCKTVHELCIANESMLTFLDNVGFCDPAKARKLSSVLASYKRAINRDFGYVVVKSVTQKCGRQLFAYPRSKPGIFEANGLLLHCGCPEDASEISVRRRKRPIRGVTPSRNHTRKSGATSEMPEPKPSKTVTG